MEKKFKKWRRGKRVVVSFLLTMALLLSVTPEVHAEDNQTSTEEVITPNIVRHEGYSRDNVAENVAKAHFSDSNKVIIVNREKFPDAISATNISQGRYPVLYTHEGHVTEDTMKLIQSMALDEIYILGGTLSINESVENQLEQATNVKVTRVAGRSRYDANASAVRANFDQKNHVVIASGEVYSDALYGVSYANTIDAPVVLAKTNRLEPATVELLKDLGVDQATIIGGPLSVTPDVENQLSELGINHERIAGRNRYIGSAEVANASYENPENVVIASGEVFSDALVSAPLAQKLDAPILLVRSDRMEDVVEKYLTNNKQSIENVYIQGGSLTISEENQGKIEDLTTYLIESRILPFETVSQDDDTLLSGEKEIVQEGVDGFEEIFYNVTYVDGEEISRTEIDRVTVDPVPEIINIGTRIDIESISLPQSELALTEGENHSLTPTILPENSTNNSLIWSSSDESVVSIDNDGTIQAVKSGKATITVSDVSENITDQLVVTVKEPTIHSIEDLTIQVIQYDDYSLPTTVTANMSNNTTKEVPVSWITNDIDTSVIGTKTIEGIVEGYEDTISLNLVVEKYDPNIYPNAYSNITVGNNSRRLSLSMINQGTQPVNIDKIEIYEQGDLYSTYTPEQLSNSGIPTEIQPGGNWGMSISYKIGIWLDGSYVKYYVTANNTNYEYEVSLESNW